jgi:hypothetical protein
MNETATTRNVIRFLLVALLFVSMISAVSTSAEAASLQNIADYFVIRFKVHFNENYDTVFGPIKSFFTKASDQTTQAASGFWNTIKKFTGIDWVKEKFNQFVTWLKESPFFGGIINFFSTIIGAVGGIFSFVPAFLEAMLANIWIAAFLTGISVAMPFSRHLSANKKLGSVIVIVIILLTTITLVAAKQNGDEETVKSSIIFIQIVNLLFLISLPFGKEKAKAAEKGTPGESNIKKVFLWIWELIKGIFKAIWFVLTNIPWAELFKLIKPLAMLALLLFGGVTAFSTIQAASDTLPLLWQGFSDWINGILNKIFGLFDNMLAGVERRLNDWIDGMKSRIPSWLGGGGSAPAPSNRPPQTGGAPPGPAPAIGTLAQQAICNQQFTALGGTCTDKTEAQSQIGRLTQLRGSCQDTTAIDARFSAIVGAYAGCS